MALSKPADNDSALAVLRDSLQYFKATLCQFRVCHDLCATSNLLDEQSVKQLDQCATDFRCLSTTVATLAEKVASVWCRTCLLFYRNIDKMKGNPTKVLNTIGMQSKELSDGFKRVVAMAKQLADKFQSIHPREHVVQQQFRIQFEKAQHDLTDQKTKVQSMTEELTEDTTESSTTEPITDADIWEQKFDNITPKLQEAPVLKESKTEKPVHEAVIASFENRQLEASKMERKAAKEVEYAQCKTQAAKRHANHLKWRMKLMNAFPPLQILLPNTEAQAEAADMAVEDAQEHERIATKKVQEAQRKLDKMTDQAAKAKVLASQLGSLMVTLGQVEVICFLIQTFWSSQADYYEGLAKDVTSPEELQDNPNIDAQSMVKWLVHEKDLLEKYHQVLTVVNSSYNFQTSKCSPGYDQALFSQPLSLPKLGVTLPQ